MPAGWRTRGALVLTVAALAAGPAEVIVSAGAQAADTIVIDGVSAQAGEVGLLSLQAEATSAITTFTVNIDSAGSTVLALPDTDFAQTAGGPTDGTWTLTTPITADELPYGAYQVTVTATDSGGDTVTDVAAGSYAYLLEPAVTLTPSPASLNYSAQSLTLSGSVSAVYPDGTTQPLASQPVTITSSSGTWSATTDDSGDYTATASPELAAAGSGLSGSFTASVTGGDLVPASSPAVTVSGTVSPVQITASLSSSYAQYGTAVTASGQAQYELDGTWAPLTAATVTITGTFASGGKTAGTVTATTDASGDYSVQLPAAGSATWTASVAADPYLSSGGSGGGAALAVQLPTREPATAAHYTADGHLVVTSCVAFAAGTNAGGQVPGTKALTVQYASAKAGPWHNLTVASDASARPACSTGVAEAWLAKPSQLSGYYRVKNGGDYLDESSYSAAAHAATTRTRITGFSISPRTVSPGGRITVKGLIQKQSSGWHALGKVRLYLLVQPRGVKGWLGYYKKFTASANGRFRLSFADPESAHWAVYYAGSTTHLTTQSKVIQVTIRGN